MASGLFRVSYGLKSNRETADIKKGSGSLHPDLTTLTESSDDRSLFVFQRVSESRIVLRRSFSTGRTSAGCPSGFSGPGGGERSRRAVAGERATASAFEPCRASFDQPGETPAIAVQNGTYAPSTVVSSSFGFSFNLNIEHERTLIASPVSVHEQGDPVAAAVQARESSSLYYQSSLFESRRSIAGGFSEVRQLQTELFYSRSRELSVSMPSDQADRFGQTSERVARTFQLDISLEFSFLGQFTRQSESIGELDNSLLDRYLAGTDARSGSNGDAL